MKKLLATAALLSVLSAPAQAANLYVDSVGYTAVPVWTSAGNHVVGDYTRQTAPAVNSERVFKATSCTTCISAVGEPTWVTTIGGTTTDGGVTWTEVTGTEANQAAGNWTAPAARILAFPATRVVAGDTLFVGQDHAETQGATLTIPNSNINVFCVSRVGAALPPVTADLATTCSASTTTSFVLTVQSAAGGSAAGAYIYGFTFNAGSGSSLDQLQIGGNGTYTTCNRCVFKLNTTSGSSVINLGGTSAGNNSARNILIDSQVQFGAAGQAIVSQASFTEWFNTSSFASANTLGTVPTNLVVSPSSSLSQLQMHGLDLSNITTTLFQGGANFGGNFKVWDCKLNSGVTILSSAIALSGASLAVDNCDDTGAGRNYRFFRGFIGGQVSQDISVVRTGGASDGAQGLSWNFPTNGSTSSRTVAILPPLTKRFNTIGSQVTATVYFIANSATALTNAQIWLEVEALVTSGVPQSGILSNAVANWLPSTTASAQPTDTSAWDTGATQRANAHAYSLGDIIAVSTNSGRIFFCTTAGTSSGSVPGGYATAVDGGAVTDGTAVFRAGMRQKLTVAFTPRVAGVVFGTVKAAVASTSIWIDPLFTIGN